MNEPQTSQAPQRNNLGSKPAVLRATVTIKRKATGKVETYEIIGTPVPAAEEPKKED